MKNIKDLLFTFTCITTGSTIAAAIFITTFFHSNDISSNILWQILSISAICTFGNFLYPKGKLTKQQLYFFHFIHYIYINIIVIGGGILFDWFNPKHIQMILFMVVLIAITFISITLIFYLRTQKESEKLNERLKKYNDIHKINHGQ